MIVPNVSSTIRNQFPIPKLGAIIYNTDTNKHQGYNGTWHDLY